MTDENDTPAHHDTPTRAETAPDRPLAPITVADSALLRGQSVFGVDGVLVGTAGAVLMDPKTAQPQWITVTVGDTGADRIVVPLARAAAGGCWRRFSVGSPRAGSVSVALA